MNTLLRFLCPLVLLAAPAVARADWTVLQENGPAPIRSIVRRSDGLLLGPRAVSHAVEVQISATEGRTWRRHATVISDPKAAFGDPICLAVPGSNSLFCAFREIVGGAHRVLVCRSADGGDTWAFDSVVTGPHSRFVGAPFLLIAPNGDLQCYYDSEPLAADNGRPGHQWIAMRGREGLDGPWDRYGVVTVSREANPATLTRDGLPTVVALGGDRLMCFTEGVETEGHGAANVIRAIPSWDGGKTWDFAARRIVYQARVDPATNRRYNAYDPYAIRVGGGPVWVAFCTDEDYPGPPDLSHQPVIERHAHIKAVHTLDDFETWSEPQPIWTRTFSNYSPGLFEIRRNHVLATVDRFQGNQAVLTNIEPFAFPDAVRALTLAYGGAGASQAETDRLDAVTDGDSAGVVDTRDAVYILRVALQLGAD